MQSWPRRSRCCELGRTSLFSDSAAVSRSRLCALWPAMLFIPRDIFKTFALSHTHVIARMLEKRIDTIID